MATDTKLTGPQLSAGIDVVVTEKVERDPLAPTYPSGRPSPHE